MEEGSVQVCNGMKGEYVKGACCCARSSSLEWSQLDWLYVDTWEV